MLGVFLLKLPAFKSRPACVAIEIDVAGVGGGNPRGRGLIIRSKEQLQQLVDIINNGKVMELSSSLELVNPAQISTPSIVDSEVFEIWQVQVSTSPTIVWRTASL